MNKIMKNFKAFTLVELMVVMAIIAFLSVGAYAGLTFALRQGRDTQRMQKVDSIQTALVAYFADFQSYPSCPAGETGKVTSNDDFIACSRAFDPEDGVNSLITLDPEDGGLNDYFEGEFVIAPIDEEHMDDQIRYYGKMASNATRAMDFTVCVALENPRGGNQTFSGQTQKGCYCVGAEQSSIACSNMEPLYAAD